MKHNICDIHSAPSEDPEESFDEEDVHDLAMEAFVLLNKALQIRQPKWLQSEAIGLVNRIEKIISFERVH